MCALKYVSAYIGMAEGAGETSADCSYTPLDVRKGLTSVAAEGAGVQGDRGWKASSYMCGAVCRWGFLGAGRVCHDFVQALKYVPGALVGLCMARVPIYVFLCIYAWLCV
jgi:hypothetical protein